MKKLVTLLICLSLIVGLFVGCGKDNDAGGNEPNDASADQSNAGEYDDANEPEDDGGDEKEPEKLAGEVTYWSFTDSANNLVDEFAAQNSDIKINLQVFGGDEYKTKLMTTIQSGQDIPDLFDLEENYVYEFFESDVIDNLSARGFDELLKDFYPYMVAGSKDADGNIKGINFQTSPIGFWYLRDACKEWLGTDDPDEISNMMKNWDEIKALATKVKEDSGGKVYLWPNTVEMVKVVGFSFEPFVRDGNFSISDDWLGLIDTMRDFRESEIIADLGSWSEDWAAKWNEGEVLFRVMPSWDFFTDWDKNSGNVGIAKPFENAFEGATLISVYSGSEKKELCDEFLKFIISDEFQIANMEKHNQVPASSSVAKKLAEDFSAEDFGGQNLMKTYDEINSNIVDVIPDKYTRPIQNLFQKHAEDGVKAGLSNDEIIGNFKAEVKDKYPELTGLD